MPETAGRPIPIRTVVACKVTESFLVWPESALRLVPRDVQMQPEEGPDARPVRIDAARGESENFQLVVSAREQGAYRVETKLSPFGRTPRDASAGNADGPRPEVSCARLGYVEPFGVADVLRPPTEMVFEKKDDYGANLPLLFTVTVPRDASPGRYTTTVELTVNGEAVRVPVELKVRSYTLPRESHFRTALFLLRYQKSHMPAPFTEAYQAWAKRWMTYLAERRISHDNPFPYSWRFFTAGQQELGRPAIDVTRPEWLKRFDDWTSFWHEHGLHINNVQPYGFRAGSPEFTNLLSVYGRHLREEGWLGQAFCRTIPDEFDARGEGAAKAVVEYARQVRAAAPGLKVSATAMKPRQLRLHKIAAPGIDIWMLHRRVLDHSEENRAFFRSEMEKGKQLWLYVHQEQTLGTDPLAVRRFFLEADALGATGCVLWCMTWWHRPGARFQDGTVRIGVIEETEGCLFWPGERDLLPSLRLEHLRDGLEDVERLRLLRNAVAAWEKGNPDLEPPAAVSSARSVLSDVPGAFRDRGSPLTARSLRRLTGKLSDALDRLESAALGVSGAPN